MFIVSFSRSSSARAAILAAFCRGVPDGFPSLSTPEGLAGLKAILLDTGELGALDDDQKIRLFLLHLLRTDAADAAFVGVHVLKHHLSAAFLESALGRLDKVVSEVLAALVADRDILTRSYVRNNLPGLSRMGAPRGSACIESALDVFKAVAQHEPSRLEEDFPDAVELANLILRSGFRLDVQPAAFVLRPSPPALTNASTLNKFTVAEFLTAAKGVEAALGATGFSHGVSAFAGVAKVYGAHMAAQFVRQSAAIEALPFLKHLLEPPHPGPLSLATSMDRLQQSMNDLKFIVIMMMSPTHQQCDLLFSSAAVPATALVAARPQRFASEFPVLIPLLFPHDRGRAPQLMLNARSVQTALSAVDSLVSVCKLQELASFRNIPDTLPDVLKYFLTLNRFFAGVMPGIDWVHTLRGSVTGTRTASSPFITGARQVVQVVRQKVDTVAVLSPDCMTALSEAAPNVGGDALTPSSLQLLCEIVTACNDRRDDDHLDGLIKTLLNFDGVGVAHPSLVATAFLWDPKRKLAGALASKLSMLCGGAVVALDHVRHRAVNIIIALADAASPNQSAIRSGRLQDIPNLHETVTDVIQYLFSHAKWSHAPFGPLRKLLAYHSVCHFPGTSAQRVFQRELQAASNEFTNPTWLRAVAPLLTRCFAVLGCIPTGPPTSDSFVPFAYSIIDTLEGAKDAIASQLAAVEAAVDTVFRTALDGFGERLLFSLNNPDWTNTGGLQGQRFVQSSALEQFRTTLATITQYARVADIARSALDPAGARSANVDRPRPPPMAPPERPKRPRLAPGAASPSGASAEQAETVIAKDQRFSDLYQRRACLRSLSALGCSDPSCAFQHLTGADLNAAQSHLNEAFPRKFVLRSQLTKGVVSKGVKGSMARAHFRRGGGK